MADDPPFIIKKVTMPDTGIGKAAGYKDDKDLARAVEAERAKLPADVREAIEEGERRALNAFIYGDPDYEPASDG